MVCKKNIDKTYQFKLWPNITHQDSYKYKFWNAVEKKNRDRQIYSPFSLFIWKGFTFERVIIKGLNLTVRVNENQTRIESFFLHRSPSGDTKNIKFALGRSHYRNMNLYFVYDIQNKQWSSSGTNFFNEAICEKVTNRSFILREFGKKCYHTKKKGNGYAIGHVDQRWALGNRSYLMPIVWDNDDIWVAENEIFYTAANSSQMRGRTFLTQKEMKYMGSHWLNDDDLKELCIMLQIFWLQQLHSWMKVNDDVVSCQNELIFFPFTYYGSYDKVGYPAVGFEAVFPGTKKHKEWFGTEKIVFMKPYITKIPKPLKYCEELLIKMF